MLTAKDKSLKETCRHPLTKAGIVNAATLTKVWSRVIYENSVTTSAVAVASSPKKKRRWNVLIAAEATKIRKQIPDIVMPLAEITYLLWTTATVTVLANVTTTFNFDYFHRWVVWL
jgi:hypothetical protein